MDRMLVVVFDNDDKAHEGSRVLRDLEDRGYVAVDALNTTLKQKTDQAKARREAFQRQAQAKLEALSRNIKKEKTT